MRKTFLLRLTLGASLFAAAALAQAPAPPSLVADAKAAWLQISGNAIKAARKARDADYAFQPTPEVRTFGQLVGHLTDGNYMICSALHLQKKTPTGTEKKFSAKADLVRALEDSVDYCTAAANALPESDVAQTVNMFGRDRTKLSVLHLNIAHVNEHYGNLATYLRLRGLVPPSSEPRPPAAARARVYYDQSHGQAPPVPGLVRIAEREGWDVHVSGQSLTPEALRGSRVLYLRVPTKEFAAAEADAITAFVKGGGSLLFVTDEEQRVSLAVTKANAFLDPFGLRLTADTPYLHNTGAVTVAGEIHSQRLELPYSGGRAVEGGTPFAFQLDKDGRPAQPFAASTRVPGGGKVVVMAEAMASLLLGRPEGERLTGVPRDAIGTVYWGKDSAIFMQEVVAWLLKP